ncbi:MAG: IS481 family transposase [Thermomicrobiales bacterium]|nr:IS481 family transposase [Thermomicrobiales bacterium]
MPWQEQSAMSLRQEFVALASHEHVNIRELCRRYGISAKTGYKWLGRARVDGAAGLVDRSRRPRVSPTRTAAELEARVVDLRRAHPTWGGRKIAAVLTRTLEAAPAPSTITAILHRHGLIAADPASPRRWRRFAHPAPNVLWQLEFMGHRALADGQRVHPLTILDDHSRFALGLLACACEQRAVVQMHRTVCFRRYGLPQAILTDHGPPWGGGGVTALEAWLIRLGIELWHGRAYHPQTQGKIERLHGAIAADVFAHRRLPHLSACQPAFDAFRTIYNHERPHAALGDAVPASRYVPSPRAFPAALPEIVYGPDDQVRRVRDQGAIGFRGRSWFISRGLIGLPVAVRPTTTDGLFQVVFCHKEVTTLDLRAAKEV